MQLPVVIIISFIAVFLIILALYLAFSAAKDSPKAELRRRLRRMAKGDKGAAIPEDVRAEITKETPTLDKVLSKIPFLKNVDKKLDHAGLKITVATFCLILAGAALVGFFVGILICSRWEVSGLVIAGVSMVCAVFMAIIPFIYLEILKRKRIEKFTELFPDALTMIARSLRSGHSFTSAIELIGKEISDPVGGLFKTAYDQQLLGLRITEALNNMNERIESIDLRFFTTAVGINTEVGGNLAEILDKLAETIRDRLRIKRQVRVYTAQARMSGYVLAALPIITFFLLNLLHPGYQEPMLKEPMGIYILIFAGVMQILGFLVIRKIINIRI